MPEEGEPTRPDTVKARTILADIEAEAPGAAERLDVQYLLAWSGFTYTEHGDVRIYEHAAGVRFTIHMDFPWVPRGAAHWLVGELHRLGLIPKDEEGKG